MASSKLRAELPPTSPELSLRTAPSSAPTEIDLSENPQPQSTHISVVPTMHLLITLTILPLIFASPLSSPSTPLNLLTNRAPATCGTCNPSPPNNICNPTTACATIGTHTYCACRAGYRATTGASPGDTSVQWRLPTQGQAGRVFVEPGVTCDTLCDQWQLGPNGCREVGLRADCA